MSEIPRRCALAGCHKQGTQTVTLWSGAALVVCADHKPANLPSCDCLFYLAVDASLSCSLPAGHSGDHRHPQTNLYWMSA